MTYTLSSSQGRDAPGFNRGRYVKVPTCTQPGGNPCATNEVCSKRALLTPA